MTRSKTVRLVGVLNITPDSFSDGGLWQETAKALAHAQQMVADGAAIIDVGAESTRPGAEQLAIKTEWHRLEPVLIALKNSGIQVSLDSRHVEVVRRAAQLLPNIIVNDVTGFCDPGMRQFVADKHLRCIVSHLAEGLHGDIQAAHAGELIGDEQQVVDELKRRQNELMELGVPREAIILDPGIGFGKTPDLNRRLLTFARHFPNDEVMIGYSRKRFLGDDRMTLAPNLAAGKQAIRAGGSYLRVHDVAGHAQLISPR